MNGNLAYNTTTYRKVLWLPGIVACSVMVVLAAGQDKPAIPVRERVAKLVQERLSDWTVGVVNGVRVQTRKPPSSELIKEIRECGNAAIPVLENYLRLESEDERRAAVELLGLLGGSRVVAPLKNVVEKDRAPALRILALRWLSQSPSSLALPIIQKTARTDIDENVRQAARSILDSSVEVPGAAPFKVVPRPF